MRHTLTPLKENKFDYRIGEELARMAEMAHALQNSLTPLVAKYHHELSKDGLRDFQNLDLMTQVLEDLKILFLSFHTHKIYDQESRAAMTDKLTLKSLSKRLDAPPSLSNTSVNPEWQDGEMDLF